MQPAPAGYTVPGAQEIVVKSVRALVDGSGAGAAFQAVLQLVAADGSIVWEAPTDSTIAAGGSANVSWFPRVGAGGGAATGLNIPWCEAENPTSPSLTTGVSSYVPFPAGDFVDSGTGTYATATGAGGQATVQITQQGIYLALVNLGLNATSTIPGPGASAYCNFQGGFYQLGTSTPAPFVLDPVTLQYAAPAWSQVMWNLVPAYGNIPTTINIIAEQTSGSLLHYAPQLLIFQLNATGNSGF